MSPPGNSDARVTVRTFAIRTAQRVWDLDDLPFPWNHWFGFLLFYLFVCLFVLSYFKESLKEVR